MKKFRPGVSFADFLIKETASRPSRVPRLPGVKPGRAGGNWLGAVIMIAMGLLLVRLATLQLFYGGRYRLLSDENRVLRLKLPAPRGQILDRNGVALAVNQRELTIDRATQLTIESFSRDYPLGKATSHLLGYLGEVDQDEVGLLPANYGLGDWVGRSGIEQAAEAVLAGQPGGRLVEVDSGGAVVRELGRREAIPGKDVHLSLDSALQKTGSDALAGKKGAVVAANPQTGEILVLASSPSFFPQQVAAALADAELPLLNRAVGGLYPPGSVFKLVTAAAALSEEVVGPGFTWEDTGLIQVGRFVYPNWLFTQYGRAEGVVGWARAIARSTDTFFYKVGEAVGPELLANWGQRLGLGTKTGVDIPGEVVGLVPTPQWKEQVKGEQWFLGNTYHLAIGQGDILTTPIQVNLLTNIIAAGGNKCQLHLLKSAKCDSVEIGEEALKIIRQGMVGACSPGGTAFPLFDFKPQVACKTGTAEYARADGRIGTHAWLTAFAPADDPTISVTVLVEGGGEGSRVAAPIARKVLVKYFGVEDKFNYAAVAGEGE